ncbi:MAG: sensor domain-containing diguanylate cyclase [Actinomycetota bacterium]
MILLGLALAAWLVVRVADSLTRPILALTEAAERVARGDLTTRTQAQGSSELDRLSDAFNHMTDELQAKLGELESSRNLLRENVGRLGDTLQRTHDLDGLLMTVLGAAASATVSQRATVWLVEGGSVVARVSSPAGAPRPTTRRLPLGTELAGVVAADGLPRRLGHGQGDGTTVLGGPALAAPLRRGHHVLGVIVVERDPQQPAFDADDEAMLVSLAGPAGIAVDNVMLHREAQRLSVTDPLTGAGNLRHMTTTLAREVERATRFQRPLSLLLLDLDFFKTVNDTYGHTVGDAVLRELARRLASCVREVDVVARYGGEEFVVVTPETDIEGAERLAARICEAVREEPFVVGDDVVKVTVSVGIASLPQHGSASGDLVRAADEGLYAAKHAGRDRYRVASSGEPAPAGDVTADR